MPSSVRQLLSGVGLQPEGCVRWGQPAPERRTGVYLVSLTSAQDRVDGLLAECPLSDKALAALMAACPEIQLDGATAGEPLRTRVRQYYRTPLGAAKPHRGGWWLKALSVLDDLWVHYAATPDFDKAEAEMLRAFAARVSDASRRRLPAGEPVMPFANLRDGDWRRKQHGLTGGVVRSIVFRSAWNRSSCGEDALAPVGG